MIIPITIRGNCQLVWKYSNRCWNIYLTETKYLLKLYFKFISISITHIHIDTSNVHSFPLKMYIVYSGFIWFCEFLKSVKIWRERSDLLCPHTLAGKLCWYQVFVFSSQYQDSTTLTFLEVVETEVANPPRLHVEVSQRCLVGRAQTTRLKFSLEALLVQL